MAPTCRDRRSKTVTARAASAKVVWSRNGALMTKKDHRLHEDLSRDDKIEGSSDRGFGLVFAAFSAIVAASRLWKGQPSGTWWVAATGVTLAVALLRPGLLAPLNRLWLKLGLLLFRIISPLTLGLLFFLTITPIGLLMRALNKDFLRRRLERQATNYWILREPPGPAPETLKNQY